MNRYHCIICFVIDRTPQEHPERLGCFFKTKKNRVANPVPFVFYSYFDLNIVNPTKQMPRKTTLNNVGLHCAITVCMYDDTLGPYTPKRKRRKSVLTVNTFI